MYKRQDPGAASRDRDNVGDGQRAAVEDDCWGIHGRNVDGANGHRNPTTDAGPGARHAHRIAMQLRSTKILPYVAVNKDAFPTSPAYSAGCFKSVRLPKQAQLSRESL